MTDAHNGMFTTFIIHPNFKVLLLKLLDHGETSVRMKSHEILEALTNYFVQYCDSKTIYEFADRSAINQGGLLNGSSSQTKNEIMDAEFISHERLFISQIVIQVARKSLE